MAISQVLLPEFDFEMATTRKVLERVPDDRFEYKPHEKSFAMGKLASHIATIPFWGSTTIKTDSLDLAPPGQPPMQMPEAHNKAELLELFDKNVGEARAAIEGASDELLMKPWTLLSGGKEIFTQPKAALLRTFVISHIIHHRGQMTVYLRLNNLPVPSVYGPSADEGAF